MGAVFIAGAASSAAAQGSGGVVPAHKPRAAKPAAGATAAAPAPAPADSVKVNEFMSYDPATKTVTLKIFAAHGSTNGGMNLNGGANGSQTITVPVGWTVAMTFTNEDAIPHSAILLPNTQPFPAQPQDPAIPRAYTADVTGRPHDWQDGSDDVQGLARGRVRPGVRRSRARAQRHVDSLQCVGRRHGSRVHEVTGDRRPRGVP